MKIICTTFGSAGDVYPLLGLAIELRRRGHDLLFATNQHFAPLIRGYGLEFTPLGTEADFQNCLQNPDLWNPQRGFRHIFDCLRPILRQQYDLHAAYAQSSDTVAISNCFGFGARLAQEKLGLKLITLHLQPGVIWSDLQPPTLPGVVGPRWLKSLLYRLGEKLVLDAVACPYLNHWRAELGLPPIRRITQWWNSPYGVLCMFPDWFAPPQIDWPANLMQTDFPLWNPAANEPLADDVTAFLKRGERPIVFTPGSANVYGKQFFETAVEACSRLGRRGILLTEFPEQLPATLPESITHFKYVAMDRLLPQTAAFVHHGGVGSTSQAMHCGTPQVVMPLAHDQFDNAARVIRLGIGQSISVRKFNAPRLTHTLQHLLSSESVSANCQFVAKRLTAKNGIRRSADVVERKIAAQRNPYAAHHPA
ncbi:MAG: glycosyltransferase [Planctomycetota bacterium]|nr:glycosyltransferase [Planctomycetota bacterium]